MSQWRRALGVGPSTAGTRDLRRKYAREDRFAAAWAKARATPWTADRRARLSERFKGKPVPPATAAAIRKAQRKRRGAKHTDEARAKMRAAAARRLAGGRVPNGRAWTPAEDELVRTRPAAEVARRTGHPVSSVYKRRRKLRVPDGRRAGPAAG